MLKNKKQGKLKNFILNWLLNLKKEYSRREQIINIFIFLTTFGTVITLIIFEVLTSNKNASNFIKAMTMKFSTTESAFLVSSWTFFSILICCLFLKLITLRKRRENKV